MDVSKLTKTIEQFQTLIAAILALLVTLGFDKAGLLNVLQSPTEWTAREFVVAIVVLLVIVAVWIRQRYANASRLLDRDALRLDPKSPDHLLGRKVDIDRIRSALVRSLVFLTGESGCGKSALLQAGLAHDSEVNNQYLPISVDMTDLDEQDDPLWAVADAFRRALPETERAEFLLEPTSRPAELPTTFTLYQNKFGRRPLLLLDQFDDYQAHHLHQFQTEGERIWRSADDITEVNGFWWALRACLEQRAAALLIATRKDEASGLECVRLLAKPASLQLDRLERGYVRQIIERLTTRPPGGAAVIANSANGWTALCDRIADQLELRGAVLPQQLKLILLGLPSLRPLVSRSYDRAGGLEGIEAAFVRDAIIAASRLSELNTEQILNLLLLMVDDRRQPPAKAAPRSAITLVGEARISVDATIEALKALAEREIVRPRGELDDADTVWQLDHDYLAPPILRLRRERERWQILLDERTKAFRDAGGSLSLRWRAMLSLRLQVLLALARLRGRLRYRDRAGFALGSLLTSVLTVAVVISAIGTASWGMLTYNHAERIESKLGDLGRSASSLNYQEKTALTDLSDGNALLKWLVAHDLFSRPEDADRFVSGPEMLSRALVGLDSVSFGDLLRRQVTLAGSGDPSTRAALVSLVGLASPAALSRGAAEAMLAPVLDLIGKTQVPDKLRALAQAYQAIAHKLPAREAHAQQALGPVLDLIGKTPDLFRRLALVRVYQAIADNLPAQEAQQALGPVLDLIGKTQDPDKLRALAQAYQAIAHKLPVQEAHAQQALGPVLDLIGKTQDPDKLQALAQAYQAITEKLPVQEAHAQQALGPVLDLIGKTQDPDKLQALAEAYQAIAKKLPAQEAHAQQALGPVLDLIGKTQDPAELPTLAEAYRAIAEKLPAQEAHAQQALGPVLDVIGKTQDLFLLRALAHAYRAIAEKLAAQEAHAQQALGAVLDLIGKAQDPHKLGALAGAYQAIADKLRAQEAQQALGQVLDLIGKTQDSDELGTLVSVYRAIADKLPMQEAQAQQALGPVLDLIGKTQDSDELGTLAQAYQAIADKLPVQEAHAQQALGPVLDLIGKTQDPDKLRALAQAYQAIADKLPVQEAHAQQALGPVLGLIGKTQDSDELRALAQAYRAIADKLDDTALRQNTIIISARMGELTSSAAFLDFAKAVMIGSRTLSAQETERLVAIMLRDPLSAGEPTTFLLARFAQIVHPAQPWGDDIWAFVAWARENPPGFDPDHPRPVH